MRSQRRTCERSDEGMERQQAERMDGRAHGGKSRAFPGHQNLQRRLAKGVKATEGVEITNYRRAAHQPNIGTHIRGPCGQSLGAGYKYLTNRGSLLLTALRSGSRVSSYLHLGLSCHASLRLRRSRRLVLGLLGPLLRRRLLRRRRLPYFLAGCTFAVAAASLALAALAAALAASVPCEAHTRQ